MKLEGSIYDPAFDFRAFIERPELAAFVGENFPYYKQLWLRDYEKKGKASGISTSFHWNLLAFFSPISWFGYRKMYVIAISVMVTFMVLSFLDEFFRWNLSTSAYGGMNLVLMLSSKGYYFTHVANFFQKNKDKPEEEMQILIAKQGGTSTAMAVFFLIVSLVLIVGATVLGDAVSGTPKLVAVK